uniref:phospholipase A2 n=1 Tax=Pristhesancus plagipennis TaxID=1955184 RepID=A0A2K8JM72_PRIPG|nr:secreted PLA2 protein [Pristhesancus plagipennis]
MLSTTNILCSCCYLLILVQCVYSQSDLPYKGYSGYRIRNNSKRLIFHNEQTIAVVEFLPRKVFANCELIEVLDRNVKVEALYNLSKTINREPKEISFRQMMDLINACAHLPDPNFKQSNLNRASNPLVLEGTYWCGAGDTALNYFDLGPDYKVDKCCRSHDLCPKKVRSRTTDYSVENTSPIVTMSHCDCDNALYNCLKDTRNSIADVMGKIYFNILRPKCLVGEGNVLKAVSNKNEY